MAHVSTKLDDFTHPIKRNGSLNVSQKRSLLASLRALFGKTVLAGAGTTTVNASVVQTAVAGISFRVKKNKTYRITGTLYTSTGATPGIAVGLSLAGSSAAVGEIHYTYKAAAAIANQVVTSNPLGSASTGGAAAYLEVDIDGYFVPDVSGFLTVTFAQNTSNASNTIVSLGSHVAVARVQG